MNSLSQLLIFKLHNNTAKEISQVVFRFAFTAYNPNDGAVWDEIKKDFYSYSLSTVNLSPGEYKTGHIKIAPPLKKDFSTPIIEIIKVRFSDGSIITENAFAWYVMSEPAYFEQGIEQLHTSKYIKNRIGGFSSYTFQESQLLQQPKSPVDFQVEIHGDSLNLFLTCTMTRIKDSWHLSKIKEDSTNTKHY
jgi:hypothetical protein